MLIRNLCVVGMLGCSLYMAFNLAKLSFVLEEQKAHINGMYEIVSK